LDDIRCPYRLVAIGKIPAGDSGGFPAILGRATAVADPSRVGEQIANGDRTFRGDHRITLPVLVRHRDRGLGELRQVVADRIGNQQLTLLLQQHHADAYQRFGLRGDAVDAVYAQVCARLSIALGKGHEISHFAAPSHQSDRARQLIVVDIRLDDGGQPLESLRRQTNFLGLGCWQRLGMQSRLHCWR